MVHRYVPLASFLGALLFSGCVIYTEPQNSPPPPPPPPAKAGQPASQPATTTGKKPGAHSQPQPQPATDDNSGPRHQDLLARLQGEVGQITVVVKGGECLVGIDGVPYGTKSEVSAQAAPGERSVTCQPKVGAVQTQKVKINKGETGTVTFDLANPANNTAVSKPTAVAPPVGRPTPGQ